MLFFCPKKRKVQGKAENSFQYVLSVGASVFLTIFFSPCSALPALLDSDEVSEHIFSTKQSSDIPKESRVSC